MALLPERFQSLKEGFKQFRAALTEPLDPPKTTKPSDEIRAPIESLPTLRPAASAQESAERWVNYIVEHQEENPHPLGEIFIAAKENKGKVDLETAMSSLPPSDKPRDPQTLNLRNIMHLSVDKGKDVVIVEPFYLDDK